LKSWLIGLPQTSENIFGDLQNREIKSPGGIGQYVQFLQNPPSSEEHIGFVGDIQHHLFDAFGDLSAFKHPKTPSRFKSDLSIIDLLVVQAAADIRKHRW
jgi:hypothetical protein